MLPNDIGREALPAPVVLVVDDDADIRDMIALLLSRDHKIRKASDGKEGLEAFRVVGVRRDVVDEQQNFRCGAGVQRPNHELRHRE